ncbi:hypothetical protein SAY86_007437 [Trapa natans]|uniref:F-box domain-containing protein n=1 Tax=Trapa natans TaxID=22666 RepID=A0AAN7R256_TRANT|nr:hypothetical protein SAY86_007437 [Trapa natans]
MKQMEEGIDPWSSVPQDVALKIASNMQQIRDVCNLGSCSRFWRELCDSDFLWECQARERWPLLLGLCGDSPSSSAVAGVEKTGGLDDTTEPSDMGWKRFYTKWHKEMAQRAVSVAQHIEQCSSGVSLEIRDYLKAIEDMNSKGLGFRDIQMFFFRPNASVLLNLVGLHYCIGWLGVPTEDVMEALESHKISQRQVCVKWWKVGRWFYGFRMRDESHSREVSLGDLSASMDGKKHEVLGVLHRGAVHEVLRVQISVVALTYTSWSHQIS